MRKLDMLTKRFATWMSPHVQFQRSNCYLLLLLLKELLSELLLPEEALIIIL